MVGVIHRKGFVGLTQQKEGGNEVEAGHKRVTEELCPGVQPCCQGWARRKE